MEPVKTGKISGEVAETRGGDGGIRTVLLFLRSPVSRSTTSASTVTPAMVWPCGCCSGSEVYTI